MKRHLKIIVIAAAVAMILMLSGCGSTSKSFEPDLTGTEWLGYRVESNGGYVASADYSFSQDRVKYLDRDVEYTLHIGEEAYSEALISEEDAEALYTENSFDGDERGGFVTIIMHYDNGGKDGLYGWMNSSMDKMELIDPYDGARCYLFRKDSDDAVALYEKRVEPLFDAFIKENFHLAEEENEVKYAGRVLEISSNMENNKDATEEVVKNGQIIDTISDSFDNYASEGAKLAESLESMLYLDGIKVRMIFSYKGELIGSATYDKSGEIEEERFLYGK